MDIGDKTEVYTEGENEKQMDYFFKWDGNWIIVNPSSRNDYGAVR